MAMENEFSYFAKFANGNNSDIILKLELKRG